jgi:KaiC/GvpD/RAD55 family RecA-like ATPase
MTKITIELPEEITKEAEKRGIDLKEIKKRLQTFAILDVTSRMSKLSSKEAIDLSKKIKISAWKKIKKELKL